MQIRFAYERVEIADYNVVELKNVSDWFNGELISSFRVANSNISDKNMFVFGSVIYTVVPEPATMLLLSLGGLLIRKRN